MPVRAGPEEQRHLCAVALLVLGMACTRSEPPALSSSAPVVVGARREWKVQPLPDSLRRVAGLKQHPAPDVAGPAKAWRERPTEETALALARALYPEFLGGVNDAASATGLNPATALSVKLPESGGDAMELSTRGHIFRVTRLDGAKSPRAAPRGDATFFGRSQFFASAGPAQRLGERLLTERLEEYEVVEGGGTYRARYRIELPVGIAGLRDTGDCLEFSDGKGGPPVLRMHYPQVRDAAGTVRSGSVELRGPRASSESHRSFVASGVLTADLSIDLGGLEGPLVVDPGWSSTASMADRRLVHTTTLLASGELLVAGGWNGTQRLDASELFDPRSHTWRATSGKLHTQRLFHTASLLPSGKVLVAGGESGSMSGTTGLASMEVFDPASGTWTLLPNQLADGRTQHTAVALSSGKILLTGGIGPMPFLVLNTSEIFDPSTGLSTRSLSSMASARWGHTTSRLPSGKVLVVGGWDRLQFNTNLKSAEIFDPVSGTWTSVAPTLHARAEHSSTVLASGKVLVAGGNDFGSPAPAEVFDPNSGVWTATNAMIARRGRHSATLLPSGKVLAAGGWSNNGHHSPETFDPSTGLWTSTDPQLIAGREDHTATLLSSGKVLLVGGFDGSMPIAQSELFDPDEGKWTANSIPLVEERGSHTTTLLPSGKLLHVGGAYSPTTAELFDPATGSSIATASLTDGRCFHSASLMPTGKVLVVGGAIGTATVGSAEVYDSTNGTWSVTGSMTTARGFHTATVLPSGDVLVIGGWNGTALDSAELRSSANGTWTMTGSMTVKRARHTATLLKNGKVLVAGGTAGSTGVNSAELFDPATGVWTATTPMTAGREWATATLLPSGRVLVAGGFSGNLAASLATAEVYDPDTATWALSAMPGEHAAAASVLLPSGRVLIVGGATSSAVAGAVDLFDPGTNTWKAVSPLLSKRAGITLTLLPSGKVLLAGGGPPWSKVTERYEDTGADDSWRPTIQTPSAAAPGRSISITGTLFRGVSPGGTGTRYDSPGDVPRSILQSVESGEQFALQTNQFSATALTSSVPATVPQGQYILWVVVNAIYGGRIINISNASPTAASMTLSTLEDTSVAAALTGSDADGDPLTFSVTSGPANGVLSGTAPNLTYQPAEDFVGTDSFTFKANDGSADSAPAVVNITVSPVNDPPTIGTVADLTVNEDATADVLLTGVGGSGGVDEAQQTLTVEATSSNPALVPNPVVTGSGASRTVLLRPSTNAVGSVTLTLLVRDDGGTANGGVDTASQTFVVTVRPVNDPPSFDALAGVTVLEDSPPASFAITGVHPGGGADEASQLVTLTAKSSKPWLLADPVVTGSGAARTLTFAPALNAQGTVEVTVQATDSGGTTNGGLDVFRRTFNITISPVNHRPEALGAVVPSDGSPAPLTLKGRDADGDPLTFVVASQPLHGTLSGTAPELVYTPNASFSGLDSFLFTASDGALESTPVGMFIDVKRTVPAGCGCSEGPGGLWGFVLMLLAALKLLEPRRHRARTNRARETERE